MIYHPELEETVSQSLTSLRVSVVVPVYNEAATIEEILRSVLNSPVVHEVVVVDDGSTDKTGTILREIASSYKGRIVLRLLTQPKNSGKGAALRRGFQETSGDIVIVQDADLEYNPKDYPKLIDPIVAGDADVVYGSRFGGNPRRVLLFWHSVANKFLTTLSNIMTNLNLSDMETGYKVFRSEFIKGLPIRSDRFGFEPEITAKIARLGCRIYEVPIEYRGRTYREGKKIGFLDAIEALVVILRFRFRADLGALTPPPKRARPEDGGRGS